MNKLLKEEKEYQLKMIKEFDMTRSSCRNMKCVTRKTYIELFKQLENERELITDMQNKFYDLRPKDIKDFFSHSKNDLVLAHHFVNTLYAQDPTRKMNAMFMKKAKRFKDWYDEKFKMEKVG